MSPESFIARLSAIAIAEQKRTGVLASVTIAQAALETGWGKSVPRGNLFGIKGAGAVHQTQEVVGGQWINVDASFRVYNSWEESVIDHSDFLVINQRYGKAGFFDACKRLDYAAACQSLQAAGYATDPLYHVKLRGIINAYKLWSFDKEGVKWMEPWEADTIINTWIKPSWNEAFKDQQEAAACKNEDAVKAYQVVMDNCHHLANALRKASGQPEE